jgi:hypothetical protein
MRMHTKPKYESNLQRAIRKIKAQRMSVGDTFVRHDGVMVYPVNGYLLTTEQILELDSKNELTSWGIREFAEKLGKEARPTCPVHKLEMQETAEADVPGVIFYFCPHSTGCDSRFSDKTGYTSVFDLPSR